MIVTDVRTAIEVVMDRRHWLYKQAPEDLETAVLTLLRFARDRTAVEGIIGYPLEAIVRMRD